MQEIAFPDFFELSIYRTGWTFRIGIVMLRFNKQGCYTAISLEKLRRSYSSIGGLSWKEFRAQRKAERAASLEARRLANTPVS